MTYDPLRHHRRSIRLDNYDYSKNGAYFITVCTFQRDHLFGEVTDGIMQVNEIGQIVEDEWNQTSVVRPYITLDAFVVMPNHLHGIFVIEPEAEHSSVSRTFAAFQQIVPQSVASIVRNLKAIVTKRVNRLRNQPNIPIWQRSYHEYIVRSLDDLDRLRRYIELNPAKWSEDRYYS